MSILLNIHTAFETAFVSIAKDGEILHETFSTEQKEHAAFLQPAISALLKSTGISMYQLDAVGVANGPGSYTGLRVGMASAKGLCYALNKPLVVAGTLEVLAFAASIENTGSFEAATPLLCPMIDARRMEVFTAMYDQQMRTILEPCAIILNEDSFANSLLNHKILFFGNGAEKWRSLCLHENALFGPVVNNSLAMSRLAFKKYAVNDFADLAYCEPLYVKEFFMH